MWSMSQRVRLATERELLARKMSHFQFYDPTHETYVAGWVRTSDGGNYQLKLVPGYRFPDEMCSLYVVSPSILWRYGGGTVNELGATHSFHTLSNGPGGCVQICHTKPDRWDSGQTIFAVLVKGHLWAEGHSRHVRTGNSIASFCDEVERSAGTPIIQYPY